MTNKELELRLNNIEKAIADLAKKQSDRDNANESSIVSTNSNVVALDAETEELKITQEENDTELLYQVCLLQLGITEDEFM